MQNVKKNYFFNLSYQIFVLLVPLLTTPYVSRVLSPSGVGIYSFTLTLSNYFVVFANLGFAVYGQREIAKYQSNKYLQSKSFYEIFILKSIVSLVSLLICFCIIFSGLIEEYNLYLIIFSITILSAGLETSFLFQGNEDFKHLAIRNFIVKILLISSIFIFVNKASDLWKYCLINALSPLLTALINYPFLKKYLVKVKIKALDLKKHIKPVLILFIPTLSTSIYTMIDKTMIGFLINGQTEVIENGEIVLKYLSELENGYYEQADKIVRMSLTVITSLGTVMCPRNAYEASLGNMQIVKDNVYKSFRFSLFLGVPISFGLIAISSNMCLWFFGEGYEKVPYLINIFSLIVIINGLSNVYGYQYLIPLGKNNVYVLSILSGTVFNFILNIFLIPSLYSYGAAISSIAGELLILIIQIIFLRKSISFKKVLLLTYKYFIAGIIMFGITYSISFLLPSSILNTFILIFIGIISYGVSIILLRDEFAKNILINILHKIKK